MIIKVKKLVDSAIIPEYKSSGSSGFDLYCSESFVFPAYSTALIPTGLIFDLPPHHEIQIRPMSATSLKTPLKVLIGTLDSDYKGPVGVIIHNASNEQQTLEKGTIIAQGVVQYIPRATFELIKE